MSQRLEALRASSVHLHEVVAGLSSDDATRSAYPEKWTIADTMSHLGSGAVITHRRLVDALAGTTTPDDFNPSVWDEWNAKSPTDQIADALVADAALLDALEATSDHEREDFAVAFGPFNLDFDGFLRLRLGEHVLHTWDVDVSLDPSATLAVPAAGLLLDQIPFVAARSGKPTGEVRTIRVRTTDPSRDIAVELGTESVSLSDATHDHVDLVLPAEALVRLVYGRLDTLAGLDDGSEVHLEHLRKVFPGF